MELIFPIHDLETLSSSDSSSNSAKQIYDEYLNVSKSGSSLILFGEESL